MAQEFEIYILEDNGYHVMVRNKNTSRSIVKFIVEEKAKAQKNVLSKLTHSRLIEVYAEAKARETLCLKHNYRFSKPRIINVRKVEGTTQYGLYILVNKREVLVVRKRYKTDVESYVKTLKLEYTDDQLVEKVKTAVLSKLQTTGSV